MTFEIGLIWRHVGLSQGPVVAIPLRPDRKRPRRIRLAALTAGIAIVKFMVMVMLTWTRRSIATILIGFSGVAFGVAGRCFTQLEVRLRGVDIRMMPTRFTALLSVVLVGCYLPALCGLRFR